MQASKRILIAFALAQLMSVAASAQQQAAAIRGTVIDVVSINLCRDVLHAAGLGTNHS